jgi:hypothetical protein
MYVYNIYTYIYIYVCVIIYIYTCIPLIIKIKKTTSRPCRGTFWLALPNGARVTSRLHHEGAKGPLRDSHKKNHTQESQELLSGLQLRGNPPVRIRMASWKSCSGGRSWKWLHMNCRNGTERIQITFKITGGYDSFQPNGRAERVSCIPLIHMFLRGLRLNMFLPSHTILTRNDELSNCVK